MQDAEKKEYIELKSADIHRKKSALISTMLQAITAGHMVDMPKEEYDKACKELGYNKDTMDYKKFVAFKLAQADIAIEKAKKEGIIPKDF